MESLEKFHEHGNGDGHEECPSVDKEVSWSVAEISVTYGAVLDVVLEDAAGVELSALLCAWARDGFNAAADCEMKWRIRKFSAN